MTEPIPYKLAYCCFLLLPFSQNQCDLEEEPKSGRLTEITLNLKLVTYIILGTNIA